jgi:cytoskeleton protein RodZ
LNSNRQALNCKEMSPSSGNTPREFGEALASARIAAGVSLESIAERTKISIHALRALESGEFAKLPNLVFARMFLRQYLEHFGASQEQWLPGFEASWQRLQESKQSFAFRPPAPVKRRREGPWVVGLVIVAVGVVSVLLVERNQRGPQLVSPTPSPAAATLVPTAVRQPTPPTAAPPPALEPVALVVRTGESSCWVEARVAGESTVSRLLAPGAVWEIAAGGKEVDLVFGNAGAASVEYMGEVRSPVGSAGAVARIHLSGGRRTEALR